MVRKQRVDLLIGVYPFEKLEQFSFWWLFVKRTWSQESLKRTINRQKPLSIVLL